MGIQAEIRNLQRKLESHLRAQEPPPYLPILPFVENAYDLTLDRWQREYVLAAPHQGRVSIVASRQSGKSTVTAGVAGWSLCYMPGMMILVSSRSLRQASHYLEKVAKAVYSVFPKQTLPIANRLSLLLPNGSSIVSIPCVNPDTARGFSPHMIVMDEAAFAPEPLLAVVTPSLAATGGALHMLSSADAPVGFFYEACEGAHQHMYWTRKVHWTECPRISPEFIELEKKTLGDIRFRKEYCAEFLTPQHAFFGYQGIQALFEGDEPEQIGDEDFDVAEELKDIAAFLQPSPDDMRRAFETKQRLDKLLYAA